MTIKLNEFVWKIFIICSSVLRRYKWTHGLLTCVDLCISEWLKLMKLTLNIPRSNYLKSEYLNIVSLEFKMPKVVLVVLGRTAFLHRYSQASKASVPMAKKMVVKICVKYLGLTLESFSDFSVTGRAN